MSCFASGKNRKDNDNNSGRSVRTIVVAAAAAAMMVEGAVKLTWQQTTVSSPRLNL